MEADAEIHADSSQAAGSDHQPADSPSDCQELLLDGDSATQPCCDQRTTGKDGQDASVTPDRDDSETAILAQRLSPMACSESDVDEEFLSASEGEGDDEESDDDQRLEEWAESLSDLSSNASAQGKLASAEKTELCSEPEQSKEGSASPPDSDSGVNTTHTPDTPPDSDSGVNTTYTPDTPPGGDPGGAGEASPDLIANMNKQDNPETSPSSERCPNSASDKNGKTLPKGAEELEDAIAAATCGNDAEDDAGEEGAEDCKVEEGHGGGDAGSKDCEETRQKEEEEAERRRQEEEDALTEEELQKRLSEAVKVKTQGNDTFKSANYPEALELYSQALDICPLKYIHQRAVMLSNRAACRIKEGDYEGAVQDCSKSIAQNPSYIKAYFRRADAYEKLEKLEEALKDHQKVVELDRSQAGSYHACVRLEKEIHERNEKMKAEMLGKLKDLGNMVLRPFGLSTTNFQLQQDPNTGSYSVQFVQNPPTNGQ